MTPSHLNEDRPGSDNMRVVTLEPARKEWRRPELRKLPIAATAGSKGKLSEGMGNTKNADSGTPVS